MVANSDTPNLPSANLLNHTVTQTKLQYDQTIQIHIASLSLQSLVDTGAEISCISDSVLKQLPKKSYTWSNPNYSAVKGVGGDLHKVLSCVTLLFKIQNHQFTHRFHVLDGHHSMILGMDFLQPRTANIDLAKRTLTLHDLVIPLRPISDKSSLVRTTSKQIVPPASVSVIKVQLGKRYDVPVLLEPTLTMSGSLNQFQVIPTVVQPSDDSDCFTCRVVNASKFAATLPSKFTVGIARQLSPASILHIQDAAADTIPAEEPVTVEPKVTNPDLNEAEVKRLENFLTKNSDIFATDISQLGCTNRVEHEIVTGDAPPQRKRFYRASPQIRAEIDKQIDTLLQHGFIEPSTSEWTSPVVMVKKKDGSLRFAVDYRQLNAVTQPMNFPLPRLEDIWDAIGESEAKIWSVIDLTSSFWQMPMASNSKHKTAFVTQTGEFQWNRMPFGLRNAPISFQKLMSDVFRGMTYKSVIIYMDDVVCFSRDVDSHIQDLDKVFSRLRSANLKAKPAKCVFGTNQVTYLGHILSSKGILPNPDKTKVIDNFPVPRTQKQVRSFLGIANYYRRFINGYSTIVSPLTKLLCKTVIFEWTEDCQKAFHRVKKELTNPPILAYPDMNQKFIVSTDASTSAVGFILSQVGQDGREHPISYGGRALRGSELKYAIPQLECLAIVEAVKVFHPYLHARPFTVVTDHKALQYLKTIKDENNKLARWAIALQGYDFDIKYKKGASNTNADGLSRRPYQEDEGVEAPDDIIPGDVLTLTSTQLEPKSESVSSDTPMEVTFDYFPSQQPYIGQCTPVDCLPHTPDNDSDFSGNIPQAQRTCPQLGNIYRYLIDGELPDEANQAKRVVAESDQYVLDQEHLYHIFYPRCKKAPKADQMIKQIAVPTSRRAMVLAQYHDGLMSGGHQGQDRTYDAIKLKYFWPGMYRDISNYVRGCESCQRAKRAFHFHRAPLQSLPIVDRFDRWHIDFIGPLRTATDGSRYILLIVDSFSRWCEAFPTSSQDATTVADILYKQIFTRFGAPRSLVSDRGRQFLSKLVKALCQLFQVSKVNTSPYHPQTNATCERLNSSLEQSMRAYCENNQADWPRYIPGILMAFRATPCTRSTGYSPYFLLFGRNMTTPLDTLLLPPTDLPKNAKSYVDTLLQNLDVARKTAVENVKNNSQANKRAHDSTAKEPPFFVGQMVMRTDPHVPSGDSAKLHNPYHGPHYIVDKGPTPTYKLRDARTHKLSNSFIHANRLKPYSPPEDRRYTVIPEDPIPPDPRPSSPPINPAPSDISMVPQPSTSETPDASETDSEPPQVEQIIKASGPCNKRQFKVKIVGRSKRMWLNEEDVPEVLKREFYVNKTLSGKRRKRKQQPS